MPAASARASSMASLLFCRMPISECTGAEPVPITRPVTMMSIVVRKLASEESGAAALNRTRSAPSSLNICRLVRNETIRPSTMPATTEMTRLMLL